MQKKIERLDMYARLKQLNDNKITTQVGLSIGVLGKSRKEGRDLSDKAADKILKFYPDLNPSWLLYGEGEMLRDVTVGQGDNANTQIGTNNYSSSKALEMAIAEIAEQRKLTQKSQEQIDRLIGLLEDKTDKQ